MLESELLKVIQDNLPEAVSKNLLTLIQERDTYSKEVQSLKEKISARDAKIRNLEESYEGLKALKLEEEAIRAREKAVEQREVKLEVMQTKIESANDKTNAIFQLVQQVFRGPIMKQFQNTTTPIAVPGGPGGYGSVQSCTTISNTETEGA